MPWAIALFSPNARAVSPCRWMGFESPDTSAYRRPMSPGTARSPSPPALGAAGRVRLRRVRALRLRVGVALPLPQVRRAVRPHDLAVHRGLGHEVELAALR